MDDEVKGALEELAERIYLACSSNNHSKLVAYLGHVKDLCRKHKEDQTDNVNSLINYLSNRIQTQYLNPAQQLESHLQAQPFFLVYRIGSHGDPSCLIQVQILIIHLNNILHGLRSILVDSAVVDDVGSPAPALAPAVHAGYSTVTFVPTAPAAPPTLTAADPGHSTVTFIN